MFVVASGSYDNSMAIGTQEEIDRLSKRRCEIWAGAEPSPGEVSSITSRLADLYETRRAEEARGRAGDRTEIARRAKVEAEIERLM